MPPFLKKILSNTFFQCVSLTSLVGLAVVTQLSESDKAHLAAFFERHGVAPSAHAAGVMSEEITTLSEEATSQAGSSQASKQSSSVSTVRNNVIPRSDLPQHWPESLKQHVAQFDHPDSDYWRQQIKAHEAQPRTAGWVKFEAYAVERNRDVLALSTFEQMTEAERSDAFVIVQLRDNTDPGVMRGLGLEHEVKLGGKLISGLHRYRVDQGMEYSVMLESVNAHADVLYAEPDYTIQEALVPNDPNIGPAEWWLDQINAYAAWDESTDASAIGPIAVFDNGILITHEDLATNLWVNPDEVAGNGLDDDGNGYVDDIHGITVSSGSMAHGTPVSGTICGQGDNGVGYAGSAWNCQLMELRSGLSFSGTVSDLALALPYAIEEGARISNHSWRIFTFSQMLADTVTAAEAQGHLLVAAAGNENNDIDAEAVNYPARLPNDNVLTIAASTVDESRIYYSSWGSVSVDIAAPTQFNTANSSGGYSQFSGTSQAAPVVTGAVALAWSQDPTLTYLEIKQMVLDSARPAAAWSGLTVTGGILDMEALMFSIDPDTDGDGLIDSVDPDDDNDGVLDEEDAFPRDPTETTDSDGDGVGDNSDVFPLDPTESADSDGDGVGDNADAFPNDSSETVDSDGDGVGDNGDLFPSDPTEWLDSDGDGVGDNSDVDRDNDGIENGAEGGVDFLLPARQITVTGGTDAHLVDLSAYGTSIGSQLEISSVLARGDLGSSATEYFTISINAGEYVSPNLVTGVECGAVLAPVTPAVNQLVSVIDIGGGIPGISVSVTASNNVNNFCSGINLALEYQFSIGDGLLSDGDDDNLNNTVDLDSDGDGWPDIIEVGLLDVDGDYRIDDLADEAIVTNAPDDDGDGIPNHLDLESDNPLNDGTAYDIYLAGYAALDSNGDGRVTLADSGAGSDTNGNGIDDLVESTEPQPDSDRDGAADSVDVFPLDPTEWLDSDGDGLGDNADAFPADPTETVDTDGDGTGDNTDPDIDNDGLANDAESPGSANIVNWPTLGDDIVAVENTLLFDDGGNPYPRQANSSNFSTFGYSDQYQLSWGVDSSAAEYGVAVGLGISETDASLSDIDYGFWFNNGWYGVYENGTSLDIWGSFVHGSSQFNIVVNGTNLSYVVDGIVVRSVELSTLPDFYVDSHLVIGDASITNFVLEPLGGFTGDVDADDDGVEDRFDLDSDNDTIPDIVEIGLADVDSDMMIDELSDEASVTNAPDADGDGIPNHLDPESLNPANDGTALDINTGIYAVLDSNGNGVLDAGDVGGGNDVNGNGVDDLLESVDSDGDIYPDVIDVFPADSSEWADGDGDGVGDNSDVFPADSSEWLDSDGDGVGDNADVFPFDASEATDGDGDGVGDNADLFPLDPNESTDGDGDGIGDNADVDHDNDGIPNILEGEGSSSTAEEVAGSGYARSDRVQLGLSATGVFGAPISGLPVAYVNPVSDGRSGGKSLLGFIADSGRDGFSSPSGYDGDYFLPGSPEETFGVEVDGVARANSASGNLTQIPGAIVAANSLGASASITWQGSVSGLSVEKSARVYSEGLFIQNEITLTNTTSSPFAQVYFMNNVDPDNDHSLNNSFSTLNTVRAQSDVSPNNLSHVTAEQNSTGPGAWSGVESDGASLAYVSYDDRARVTYGGFSNRSASDIYNANGALVGTIGSSLSGDNAISIAFNVGALAPGESATFVYYYHFGQADDLSELEIIESGFFGGDSDGDGLMNNVDLDSDNDSIPDIIEVGLFDTNGDFIVDDIADQGSVSSPIDSDSDGIPDFLDLESNNPLNDGTAFDIATRGFASADSNGDGMVNGLDVGGGVDANNNGVDDLVEQPDADGDRFPDSIDVFPADSTEWADSDGDGVGDNADVFPADSTEWADSDGDGVGDNADAFPLDATESADTDGDGVGDNSDAFPLDPLETLDSDGDGIGDNSDVDHDNDGLSNDAEASSAAAIVDWPVQGDGILAIENTLTFVDDGGVFPRQANSVTFDQYGYTDAYRVSWTLNTFTTTYAVALGLGVSETGETLSDLEYGFWNDGGWWGLIENGSFLDAWGEINNGVTEFAIEVDGSSVFYLVDGAVVNVATLAAPQNLYFDSNFNSGEMTVNDLVIEPLGGGLIVDADTDGDGIDNVFDLDSDNDSIPDIVEIGLVDSDGNFIVDALGDQGAVTVAPDSDADGLPDHLDLESLNPANDGTAFDIATGTFAGLDTNADGQVDANDIGGGIDANNNGVDDLIEQ